MPPSRSYNYPCGRGAAYSMFWGAFGPKSGPIFETSYLHIASFNPISLLFSSQPHRVNCEKTSIFDTHPKLAEMRKKDRRSHNPVLKWTDPRAFRDRHSLFFWLLAYLVTGIIALVLSPQTALVVKLLAAEAQADMETVISSLGVYLIELCIILLALVHCRYPDILRFRMPPVRFRRTHVSHMRLDELYQLSRHRALDRPTSFSSLSNHSSHHPLSRLRPPNTDIAAVLLFSLKSHNPHNPDDSPRADKSDQSDVDADDNSESSFDSEYESDWNEVDTLRRKLPLSHSAPPFLSTLHRLHRQHGGGNDGRVSHSSPSDDDNSNDVALEVSLTDDKNPPVFNPAEYRGQVWSDAIPKAVKSARNAARRIPVHTREGVIPDSKLTVTELLAISTAAPHKPSPTSYNACFSEEPVSVTRMTADAWRDTLISAIPYISDLRPYLDNAWLSGANSISFPHLPDFYLLWVENLLFHVKIFFDKRRRWEDALKWIACAEDEPRENAHTFGELVNTCRNVLQVIPWDVPVPGISPSVHLTTQDLALFLSSRWLNDDMINAGADYILRRLEPGSRVRILNCLFIQALGNSHAQREAYIPAAYSPIERGIRAGTVDVVWFPLHIQGNHWMLLRIDLIARTIAYADSLYNLPSMEEVQLVQWWLKSILSTSEEFVIVEADFASPRQQDGHSCGIIVLSTMASVLLKYEPWALASAQSHRLHWFLRLLESFADEEDSDAEDDYEVVSGDLASGHGNATTPDPSDYESSHRSFSDYDSCRADSPVQPLPSTPASPLPQPIEITDDDATSNSGLRLDAVDLSFDPDQEMTVDSPNPRNYSHPHPRPGPIDFPLRERDALEDYYYVSDGNESDSNQSHSRWPRRRLRTVSGAKAGSSWAAQKELKMVSKGPDFRPNKSRLGTFRSKVLEDDPNAEFDDTDVRRVRCSHCAHWLEMRALYDLLRWKEHRTTSKCIKARSKGLSTKSLLALGFVRIAKRGSSVAPAASVPPTTRTRNLPCPGLTSDSNPDIAKYLARAAVTGGGVPSRQRIIAELFPSDDIQHLKDLSDDKQRMVLRRELSLHKWKIARSVAAVFSANCLREVPTTEGDEVQPCSECQSLHRLHGFQVAIHCRMPDEAKMKHVPKAYQDAELGRIYLKHRGVRELVELEDGRSPWLKFAIGCTDGTFSSGTLTGMVQALVIKQTRLQHGKSLKNMTYGAEFSQFCDVLASTSPKAYETFRKQLGGPGLRSQRQKRAKLPRFEPDISAANISRAVNVLKKLNYSGPLALSWDDTSLEAALAVYQKSKDLCVILGSIDGAIPVTENDDLDDLFAKAQLRKADKLRVYVLSVPLQNIPPTTLAAVARGSTVTAKDLAEAQFKITNLLHEHDIHPISMSADGAEVERAMQRIIAESAPTYRIYAITNPTPGCFLELRIPLYFGQHPTIMVQDSKHALKTARNQIHTGARILIIAFFIILFAHLRELALNIAGPLFTRDVEKVDKQDDRAAARVFSASTLEFLVKYHPDHVALSIYLFVLGELVDAWQNCNIPHRERAKMVLRARFFLMAWRSHIVAYPDYSLQTQFISRESYDIFLTLCDALLSLMVAYRHYYPTYPLLPWLHSTEVCEHLFGMLRQIKKDFTYSDFLQLERKLRVLQMGAFGNLTPEEQANQTASGYHHTYFKADDLDLPTLMQFPSDQELRDASQYGFEEAAQLLKLLGIDAAAMLRDYKDPEPTLTHPPHVPKSRAPQTFLELLALYERVPLTSSKHEEIFETCEMAIAADSVDKSLAIAALPDSTDELIEKLRVDIEQQLNVVAPSASVQRADCALDLVNGNKLNGDLLTKSTVKAVRQHGRLSTVMANRSSSTQAPNSDDGPSLRQKLIQRLAAVVPDSDAISKTTGVDRYVRHTGTYGGSGAPPNAWAQNKATVQKVAAAKFVAHRAKAFVKLQWVHENMHLANISDFNPLKPGQFFIGLKPGTSGNVVLCEVVTMYTKNTMHDWIPATTSVGTPSYVYAAVYQVFNGRMFSSLSCPSLGCGTTLQFPRTHIIFSLASFAPTILRQDLQTADGHPHTLITLCAKSYDLFMTLGKNQIAVCSAVDELTKLAKSKDGVSVLPLADVTVVNVAGAEEETGGENEVEADSADSDHGL
ncbi:hypothetical protein K438DRAFT_1920853 [Mycena galopus ATCC 62051]|nr:hypothetical protein K438DRAFT_1920853 [Mycena galopus ATCC 62051]